MSLCVLLALRAIRMNAAYRLSGRLDQLSALMQRDAPGSDGVSWSEALTRTPTGSTASR
ncbi:hypothetical protein [uncultured Mameliella sp.]|uniref:hypothetical protein n=1 Tax=uncultured Mameliella sp. TaxID=1447087 RepID=UPI00262470B7|nr:hypothetical protein [uncultured Mameliella sp.]